LRLSRAIVPLTVLVNGACSVRLRAVGRRRASPRTRRTSPGKWNGLASWSVSDALFAPIPLSLDGAK